MNKNILDKAMFIISKQFKLVWGLITLFALALILYSTYQISYERSYNDLVTVTKDLSKNLDGMIEDLFQEAYTLPIYGRNIKKCTNDLNNNLKRIVFNNPNISGLAISDHTNRPICSTFSPHILEAVANKHPRTLLGPFMLVLFDQPVFFIRQKIGPYHIDIVLVAAILKNNLKTSNSWASSVVLYDRWNKKNIIEIQRSTDSNHWMLNLIDSPIKPNELVVSDELQSIDGITLKLFTNNEAIQHYLLLIEFVSALSTLIIFYLLYLFMQQNISRLFSLKRAIKIAIKGKRFYPEYQPLFDQQKNKFCGAELLVRWQEFEGNVIMPDFFIEEAEASGLIIPITLQIVETAFQEFQDILRKHPKFHLAVNLTVNHFKDPLFFNKFYFLKKKYGISAQQIIFEITERHLLDTRNLLFINKMHELRQEHFSLAIDDYGTGHASISYLQNFPFNYLKIDKLFIHAIGTNAITESLNDAIIQMAKGLNLTIIAEGVETQEQVEYLVKNGVFYLQGWYFSKAVSIDKIKELIEEKNNEVFN